MQCGSAEGKDGEAAAVRARQRGIGLAIPVSPGGKWE